MTQVCPFLGFSPVPSLMSRYCRPVLVLVIFFSFSVWPGSSAWPPVAATKAIIARAATRRQRVEAVLESIMVSVLLIINVRLLVSSLAMFRHALRPLPSPRVTRGQRYYGPLRHPRRPGLSLAGVRLRVTRPHRLGFPVLRWISMYRHAVVITPVARWVLIARGTAYSNRYPFIPSAAAFPILMQGRRHIGRFEACSTFTRVTACRLAESPCDPSVSKAPTVSLPPPPLR